MPRKTRARNTAAKMAQYKRASDDARSLERPQPEKRETSKRKSTSTKSHSPKPSSRSTGVRSRNEEMNNSELSDEEGSVRGSDKTKFTTNQSPALRSGPQNKLDLKHLAELPFVPETPVRNNASQGRKRIVAPLRTCGNNGREDDDKLECENEVLSLGDSEMPSKKRRTFVTPPRVNVDPIENSNFAPLSPATMPGTGSKQLSEFQDLPVRSDLEDLEPPVQIEKTWKGNNVISRRTERGIPLRDRMPEATCPNHSVDLNTITTSSTTLSMMFRSFQKVLLKEIEAKHAEERTEVQKIMKQFTSSVVKELRSFQSVLQMISSTQTKRAASGKSSNKVSLADWEKKLDDLTPHVKIIFNTVVISRILAFNAPLKTVNWYHSQDGSDVERASEAVQTLLFYLQPGEKKQLYSDGIGREHSQFMFTVVQNLFFNVCKDSFGIFTTREGGKDTAGSPVTSTRDTGIFDADEDRVISTSNAMDVEEKNKMYRPLWVRSGYVAVDHIEAARAFRELPNQSRKQKIRDTPTVADIASHGALRVYREVASHLHQSREYVRAAFFEELGYLMVPWHFHVNDTDQSTLKMELLIETAENDFDLTLHDIPLTAVCSVNEEATSTNQADAINKKLLGKLFLDWDSMVLAVTHEVHVVNGNSTQRKHSGGVKRTIRKLVHLIDVACEVCVQYCRVESREVFLRTHKSALQCVMIFAMLFKALIVEFMDSYSTTNAVIPELKDILVHITSLKDLMPGQQSQQKLLCSRCLRMTQKEFELLNHPVDTVGIRESPIWKVVRL